MTLAIGTALQNGTYVIDALGREDAIGPGYLATHVPSGQWVLVRVLGSRHPEVIPSAERRSAFYDYLEAVGKLGHPLLSVRLRGFEEDGVCYQILPLPLGVPFTDLPSGQVPLSPRRSLTVIQPLADALQQLRPLGWRGLQLTPDQLWMNAAALRFVGFDLPATSAYEHSVSESKLVQGLTHLLYFLLTGQRAEHTQAPLAVDVRHRLPGLPISLETALHLGSQATVGTISEWLALLPPLEALPSEAPGSLAAHLSVSGQGAGVTTVVVPGQTTQVATSKGPWVRTQAFPLAYGSTSPSATVMPKLATWALVGTGLIAGVSGLTLGLQSRLQPSSLSGPALLNPDQSFPPLPDWRGGQGDWSAPASRGAFSLTTVIRPPNQPHP
ncbi:MAG: hypothetical protein HC929_08380 [Leptolyngbyaceae cyanobacterium SM2_5_2]|nr:hypothetical protein [Leptolyngbyaceae cyanobacterium SM2_5_2]